MKRKLYLDDVRTPSADWFVVRNYEDFLQWIEKRGLPDVVSFDHDLADISYDTRTGRESFTYREKTGADAARRLVQYCLTMGHKLPECRIHSANPVGRKNIEFELNVYHRAKLRHVVGSVCHARNEMMKVMFAQYLEKCDSSVSAPWGRLLETMYDLIPNVLFV